MTYIINESIAYCEDDGTVYLMGHREDAITLSLPAQRLLVCLLQSDGQLLTRDELFSHIWDKYGLVGSGNSLNQYVSQVRRCFSQLGCESFIDTIPRIGLKLADAISIEKVSEDLTRPVVPENLPQRKKLPHIFNLKLIMFFSCIILAIFIIYHVVMEMDLDPKPQITSISGGCHLITFTHLDKNTLQKVTELMLSAGISCQPGTSVYFDNVSSQEINGRGRMMLSTCKVDNKNTDIVCSNSYYFGGE